MSLEELIIKEIKDNSKLFFWEWVELIEIFSTQTSLSKTKNSYLNNIQNISSFEFSPDILVILRLKKEIKLCFINRSNSAISLKEIGEMNTYCKIAKPYKSYIISPKWISSEVNILLFNDDIKNRLLDYWGENYINIWMIDEDNNINVLF